MFTTENAKEMALRSAEARKGCVAITPAELAFYKSKLKQPEAIQGQSSSPNQETPEQIAIAGDLLEQIRARAGRLEKKLKEIEEQLLETVDYKEIEKLAGAHSRLFEAWRILNGIKAPGQHKPEPAPKRSKPANLSPID